MRVAKLRQAWAGDLDEYALISGDDGLERGDHALTLALEQRRQRLLAVVAVPVAGLVPQPLHFGVHDAAQLLPIAAQERLEARPDQLVIAPCRGTSIASGREAVEQRG